ncbi:hypothetical protein ZHAS_00000951 [Anopheles sinensis]|uniref:Uncharacterized protein n=1 Tax=Anopheles sinensis TaxID=74873 RepID=A0A084VAT8_ANOSI|nr:hypothetical protein ZHAS_00000951 [Anopheles sinensis]
MQIMPSMLRSIDGHSEMLRHISVVLVCSTSASPKAASCGRVRNGVKWLYRDRLRSSRPTISRMASAESGSSPVLSATSRDETETGSPKRLESYLTSSSSGGSMYTVRLAPLALSRSVPTYKPRAQCH